jgi:CheY-like chemotaxis protein
MTPKDSELRPSWGQAPAGRSVVIADDNDDFRAMIAEHLALHGFVVHHAANGLEAVLAIRRLRPAAVVLDLLMPRLGGLEVLNRIRAFAPTVRVVVVTAVVDDELRRQTLLMGAVAVLTKPILVADLVDVLSGPTARAEEPRTSGERSRGAPLDRPTGPVLIVDDEPDVRDVLREFLDALGYRTVTAADGQEAIRLVREQPPQVVLLDIVMPGLGGIEALATIRGIAPETRVIMVSGVGDLETARRALAYGAFDYVPKPVDLDHLSKVLAAAFVQPWS